MKLGIVIGSIREGRVTDRQAKWIENQAKTMDGLETKIIDLKDYPMPMFSEAVSPRFAPDWQPEDANARRWLEAVNWVDALVVVTPEYNRSYSSVVKNALDYIGYQIDRKPVMIAAHGSTGGAQAVSHLRAVFPGLGAVTSPTAVMITDRVAQIFDENGEPSEEFKANKMGPQATLTKALNDLKWLSDSMAAAR